MKYLNDGSIIYNRSENPPKNIPGYRPETPWHWFPEPEPCKHREQRNITLPCGKLQIIYECKLLKQQVCMAFCNECDDSVPLD